MAEQWGPWECGFGECDKLTSIADVVRQVHARGGRWIDALDLVIPDTLLQAEPLPEVFERMPCDELARPISEATIVQTFLKATAANVVLRESGGWSATRWNEGRQAFKSIDKQPGRPELKGPRGALMLADECCRRSGLPAGLDAPELARLGIRTSVAAELFGTGLAPVAPIERPAGMRPHAARFGHCRTWEGRPRELWRAADVVLSLVPPDMAPKDGMHRAVELLASVGPLDWFMLDKQGGRPRRVNDGHVWGRRPCSNRTQPAPPEPGGTHRRIKFFKTAFSTVHGTFGADDIHDFPASLAAHFVRDVGCAEYIDTALPELRGQSGVIEWLQAAWADRGAAGLASMDDDRDDKGAAFLAVPAQAVAGLFAAPRVAMPAAAIAAAAAVVPADAAPPKKADARLVALRLRVLKNGSKTKHAPMQALEAEYPGIPRRTLQHWCKAGEVELLAEEAKAANKASAGAGVELVWKGGAVTQVASGKRKVAAKG